MRKACLIIAALALVCGVSGCSMGHAVWYESYTADGGNWERTDMNHGRIGSAFSQAGVRRSLSDQPAEPQVAPQETAGGGT